MIYVSMQYQEKEGVNPREWNNSRWWNMNEFHIVFLCWLNVNIKCELDCVMGFISYYELNCRTKWENELLLEIT